MAKQHMNTFRKRTHSERAPYYSLLHQLHRISTISTSVHIIDMYVYIYINEYIYIHLCELHMNICMNKAAPALAIFRTVLKIRRTIAVTPPHNVYVCVCACVSVYVCIHIYICMYVYTYRSMSLIYMKCNLPRRRRAQGAPPATGMSATCPGLRPAR